MTNSGELFVVDNENVERPDALTRAEAAKDTAQVLTESLATHVGRIATILTGAVRDVTHELGEWATDVFEMREAARKSQSGD